jgi:hypothetical protein
MEKLLSVLEMRLTKVDCFKRSSRKKLNVRRE